MEKRSIFHKRLLPLLDFCRGAYGAAAHHRTGHRPGADLESGIIWAASDPKSASPRMFERCELGFDFGFWQALGLENLQVVPLNLLSIGMIHSEVSQ